MPADTAKMAAIAGQGALRDLEQIRATLLRLRHEWSPVDVGLEGQTNVLVTDIDKLADKIATVSGAAR